MVVGNDQDIESSGAYFQRLCEDVRICRVIFRIFLDNITCDRHDLSHGHVLGLIAELDGWANVECPRFRRVYMPTAVQLVSNPAREVNLTVDHHLLQSFEKFPLTPSRNLTLRVDDCGRIDNPDGH